MLDIKKIMVEPEKYQRLLKSRDPAVNIKGVISLYQQRKKIQKEFDEKKHYQKVKSQELVKIDKRSHEFREKVMLLKEISNELRELNENSRNLEKRLNDELLSLPNIIHPSVPVSQNKEDKIIERKYLNKKSFSFAIKNHIELASSLGIIDFKRSVKIAGSGFPVYVGKGAQLERALINFMIDHNISKGFTLILHPLLNNTISLTASGNLSKFKDEIYSCKDDELHLIPTSEVPLTNLHRDEILSFEDLPLRYTAFSQCFRREAGTYGKRDKGLMRIHQFNKVELYSLTTPDKSEEELERLVENAEVCLKKLGLHYRVTNLASCDLAQQSSKTYDIEIWLPFIDDYSEVSSASNCLDYQARRANIKYKDGKGNINFVYTLNCSSLATPRVMIALLESNQTKEGHVMTPEVLRKYTGFDKIS